MRRALSESVAGEDERIARLVRGEIKRHGGAAEVSRVVGWRRGTLQARLDRGAVWTLGELKALAACEVLAPSTLRAVGMTRGSYRTEIPEALTIHHTI
nr:MAG TPA: hypothetical protein [Caudoviricetes sp.]DAT22794.1 MAG TPA: hypothetical protein [Caudoviricetes sp.]